MAIDFNSAPWDRLAKLAPPLTSGGDLEAAASRYETSSDVYAAAADLWEDKAMTINIEPDAAQVPGDPAVVSSITQDGLSVTYAQSTTANNQTTRLAQRAAALEMVQRLRKRSQVKSVKMHRGDYDPTLLRPERCLNEDVFIVVDEV